MTSIPALGFLRRLVRGTRRNRNPEKQDQRFGVEKLEERVLLAGHPSGEAWLVSETGWTNEGTESVLIGDFVLPAGTVTADSEQAAALQAELIALAEAATNHWMATGLSDPQQAALSSIQYLVADLPDARLAVTHGQTIVIDVEAAGVGWFVDASPDDDAEFIGVGNRLKAASPVAAAGIDLLTILLHEQGHILGLEDIGSGDPTDSANLMFGLFASGERRLPTAGQAQATLPGTLSGFHYATLTGGTTTGGFETVNSASLVYWLRADDLSTLVLNGNAVTTWQDASSTSYNFTQADPNKQPLYVANGFGVNDMAAIRFDGDLTGQANGIAPNADELVLSTSTTPRTVIIVNQTTAHQTLAGIWGRNDADFGIRRQSATAWQAPGGVSNDYAAAGGLWVNSTTNINPAAPLGTVHILTATNYQSPVLNATNLANYFQAGTNTPRPWTGDIAEVLVFDRVLSRSEQLIVENALAAKYGINLGANDYYAGDTTSAGSYVQDVFGVGGYDLVNVAFGKTATQSSTRTAGGAARWAVDGNTSGTFTANSTTHSNTEIQPWWQVDLGREHEIHQVQLFNRTDCCGDRLRDVQVTISDAQGQIVFTSPILNPGNAWGSPAHMFLDVAQLNGGAPIHGQTVRVQITHGSATNISLAEVIVLATNTESNVAVGKMATQSTTTSGGIASRAVDGNTNGNWSGGSVTHTATEAEPWWMVDLGSDQVIEQVNLYNRLDCCRERLKNVYVDILDVNNNVLWTSQVMNLDNLAVGINPYTLGVNVANENGGEPVSGRKVRVRLDTPNANDTLSLAEVEVLVQSPSEPGVTTGGSAGFGIDLTGTPGTGDWVFAGHKTSINTLVANDLILGTDQRWSRVWYVDVTDSTDAVMSFDFSDAGLAAPDPSVLGYQLLWSPDNNFETSESPFVVLNVGATVTGDRISFHVPAGLLQDGYYTLGLSETAVSLAPDASLADNGTPDTFRLVRAGGDIQFYVNNQLENTFTLGAITSITITGSSDDDTLVMDYSGGDLSVPVYFHGLGQSNTTPGDTLVIQNGSFGTVTHTHTASDSGYLDLTGNAEADVFYTGLEPVDLSGSVATDYVFILPAGTHNTALTDLGGGVWRFASTEAVPTFESTEFAIPTTGTVIVNAAAGSNSVIDVGAGTMLSVNAEHHLRVNLQDGVLAVVNDATVLDLAGTAASLVMLEQAVLTVHSLVDTVFAGRIVGDGGLIKTGPADWTLAGMNSYTGQTIVDAGTLRLDAPAANLVTHYTFDDGTAHDTSGHGFHATIQGHPTMVDGVLRFDNATTAGSYLEINQAAFADQFAGAGTFSMWVKLNTATPANTNLSGLVDLGGASASDHYTWNNGQIYSGAFRANRIDLITPNATVNRADWHLLTITHDASGWRLYQNDILVHSAAADTFSLGNAPWTIGLSMGGHLLDGAVDQVAVYNAGLSAAQVQELFARGRSGSMSLSALPDGTHVVVNAGAVLDLNGQSPRLGSLSDGNVGGGTVINAHATTESTLIVGHGGGTGSFSGLLADGSGGLSVTVLGNGTQTLGNTNTYAGTTLVQQGTLVVTANGALGTVATGTRVGALGSLMFAAGVQYTTAEAITLEDGGTVGSLSGSNRFDGSITLVDATINRVPGGITSYGLFTGSGAGEGLDLEGDFTYAVNMAGPQIGGVGPQGLTFTADNATPGFSVVADQTAVNWAAPNLDGGAGGTGGGAEGPLEAVLSSIRWTNTLGATKLGVLKVNLSDLIIGHEYQAQFLFFDSTGGVRAADIYHGDVRIAERFNLRYPGGVTGQVLTYRFIAHETTATFTLDGHTSPSDRNPILNGFTLENLGGSGVALPRENATFHAADGSTIALHGTIALGNHSLDFDGAGNTVVHGNIQTPAPATSFADVALSLGAAGLWDFNEGSGSTSTDQSGNGNDGTMLDKARFSNEGLGLSGSPLDHALDVNGQAARFQIPDNDADLFNPNAMSVVGWFQAQNLPTATAWQLLYSKGSDTGGCCGDRENTLWISQFGQMSMRNASGVGAGEIVTASPNNILNPSNASDWNFFATVIDTTTNQQRLYLNGQLVAASTRTTPIVNTEFDWLIGNHNPATSGFEGLIDNFGIFTSALTAAQIQQLYSAGLDEQQQTQLRMLGSGQVTLAGDNQHRDGTLVHDGTLVVASATALGLPDEGIATVTVHGGIVVLQADVEADRIVLDGGTSDTGSHAWTIHQQASINRWDISVEGGSFTLAGSDLADDNVDRSLVLSGGTVTVDTQIAAPDVGLAPLLHLDASNPLGDGTTPSDGDFLTRWVDASPELDPDNDLRVTHAGTAHTPVWLAGDATTIGGMPTVRFDGNDVMTTLTSFNNNYTVITVSQLTGTLNRRLITSGSATNWLLGYWGGNKDRMFAGSWVTTGGAADTNPHMYIATSTGQGFTQFYDGENILTGASTPNGAIGPLGLGAWQNNPANESSAGDVSEIFIFDTVLSAQQIASIGQHLAQKYGLDHFGYTAGTAPVDLSNTHITVTTDTTLTSQGPGDTRDYGNLAIASGQTLTLDGLPAVTFNTAQVDGTIGTAILDGDLTLRGGLVADVGATGADTLQVLGDVHLTGTLTLNVSGTPSGTMLTLIDNDGTSNVTSGGFTNVDDGDTLTLGGESYRFFTHGGDGNDVVLVDLAIVGTTLYVHDDWANLSDGTLLDGDLETPNVQEAYFGVNAFATVTEALAALGNSAGTIVINGGVYHEIATIGNGTPEVELRMVAGTSQLTGLTGGSNGLTLRKTGTQTLELTGVSTYLGDTVIEVGTLQLASPQQGVVLHYTFDDGTAIDRTGNGFDATVMGAASFVDGALVLDNSATPGQYLDINHPSLPASFHSAGTFSLWVKLDQAVAPSAELSGFANLGNSAYNDHYTWTNGQLYSGVFRQSRVDNINPSAAVDRTEWHLVTVTHDASGWRMYQNDILIASAGAQSFTLGAQPWTIGRSLTASHLLDGAIGQVAIYNVGLSAAEVQGLYQRGRQGSMGVASLPTTTNLFVAAGATFDLNGNNQTVRSLADYGGGGGVVINTNAAQAASLTVTSDADYAFSGTLSAGAGVLELVKQGSGTFTLSGNNTYSGGTTVTAGTLHANRTTGTALGSGDVLVETGGTVIAYGGGLGTVDFTLDGGTLTLRSGSTDFNSQSVTVLNDATIRLDTGLPNTTLGGMVLAEDVMIDILSVTGGQQLSIAQVQLTAGTGGVAASNSAQVTLNNVSDINAAGLLILGNGTVNLPTQNIHRGLTTVGPEARLVVSHSGALGDPALGTVVRRGGTLALTGGITLTETLAIDGNGTTGTGALLNLAGNNTIAGTITATGRQATIGATTGLLTIGGAIDLIASDLVFSGAGDIVVDGAIGGLGAGVVTPLYSDAVEDLNPIAFYTFDELINATTVSNSGSVAAWTGTLLDGATIAQDAGYLGSGLAIAGGNQRLEVTTGNITLGNEWTMSAWFHDLHPTNNWRTLTRGTDHHVIVETGSWQLGMFSNTDAPGQFRSSGYTIPTEVRTGWNHITAVAPGDNTTRFYINGVYVGTADNGGHTNVKQIGNYFGQPFAQVIDEVAFFNRAFTDAEVAGLHAPLTDANAVTKHGTGTLTLNGANTYDGATNITGGTLIATNDASLGQAVAGTTVQNGASLILQGGITVDDSLVLVGTGAAGSAGALVSQGGVNEVTGTIDGLFGQFQITAIQDTLTLSGGMNLGQADVILSGAGDIVVSGAITANTSPQGYADFLLGLNPLAYYSFDDVTGTTVHNSGSLGASTPAQLASGASIGTGLLGNGLEIGGGAERLEVGPALGDNVQISLGTEWTISSWFSDLHPSTSWRTLTRGRTTDHQVIIQDGDWNLGTFANGNGEFRNSGYNVPTEIRNGWHLVTAVGRSGGTTDYFIDGQYVGTSDRRSATTIEWIGNHSSDQPFAQMIDEFAVFDYALSNNEILGLYYQMTTTASDLIKRGSGTLTLSGDNSYTGETYAEAGTLVVAHNNALGDLGGETLLLAGGTLAFSGGVTVGENIRLEAVPLATQPGLLNLNGDNTLTGSVTVLSPTQQLGLPDTYRQPFASSSDLDFSGNFLYAVNVGGPGGMTIGDAHFTADNAPGVNVTAQNIITNWGPGVANFDGGAGGSGGGPEGALEQLMQSIRWTATSPGVNMQVQLDNLIVGQSYKLQLLFLDSGTGNRSFGIVVDGQTLVVDFNARTGTNQLGSAVVHVFEATSTSVTIILDGNLGLPSANDRNPILNALTLQAVTPAPAPSELLVVSDAGLLTLAGSVALADSRLVVDGVGDVTVAGVISGQGSFAPPDYADRVLASSPVGYWQLNETAGSTATDGVGSRDGTYLNFDNADLGQQSPRPRDPDNTSVRFDGVNNRVDIAHDTALNDMFTTSYSVEFWMLKETESNDWQRIVGKGDASNRTFGVWEENGTNARLMFQVYTTAGANNLFSRSTVERGLWYHVVVTYDQGAANIYLNGVHEASATLNGTPLSSTSPLTFGKHPNLHAHFPGLLDDVSIYDRALSAAEIQNHYAARNTFGYTAENALVTRGTGTLTLGAANTYEHGTTVESGTLLANNTTGSATGSGPVLVLADGTFSGTGAVESELIVQGGVLAPGVDDGTPGTADVAVGSLTLDSLSTFVVQLDGSLPGDGPGTYDQVVVNSAVNLNSDNNPTGGAVLDVELNFMPSIGDVFVLIANNGPDPVQGTFANLVEGASLTVGGYAYLITYQYDADTGTLGTGNDVALIVDDSPVVIGTSGDDDIYIYNNAAGDRVIVEVNGVVALDVPTAGLQMLTVDGFGGEDRIHVENPTGDVDGVTTFQLPDGGLTVIANTLAILRISDDVELNDAQFGVLSVDGVGTVQLADAGLANGLEIATGTQIAFAGAVSLETNVSMSTHDLLFSSTVDADGASQGLVIASTGGVTFSGAIGSHGPLSELDVTAAEGIQLDAGSITTSGDVYFRSSVILLSDHVLQVGGNIYWGGTVDGAHQLVIAATGESHFAADVGNTTALASLETTASGSTRVGLGSGAITIRTGGGQAYSSLTLAADLALSTIIDGDVTLAGVDGPHDLRIDAVGQIHLTGALGSSTPLANVELTAVQGILLDAGAIDATGDVTFHSATTLQSDMALSVGGPLRWVSTLDGGFALVANAAETRLEGDVGQLMALASLDTLGSASTVLGGQAATVTVRTTGDQRYGDLDLLRDAFLISGASGALTFAAAVQAGATATSSHLTATTAGATTFVGAVGGNGQSLDALTTGGGGTTTLTAGVTTHGDQNYGEAVLIAGHQTLTAENITFAATLDDDGNAATGSQLAVQLHDDGRVNFGGFVGGVPLDSLTISSLTGQGMVNIAGGGVSTTVNQHYHIAVILGSDAGLTSSSGDVVFENTIDSELGSAYDLAVNAVGVIFRATVGGASPLANLDVAASTAFVLEVDVTSFGAIDLGIAATVDLIGPILVQSLAEGLTIHAAEQLRIEAEATLQAAESLLLTAINGATVTVAGQVISNNADVIIQATDDNNTFTITGTLSAGTTILLETGSGDDTMSIDGALIAGGNIELRSGDGDDVVRYNDTRPGTVSLLIDAGHGDNQIDLVGTAASGQVTILTESGSDSVRLGSDGGNLDTVAGTLIAVDLGGDSGDTLTLADEGNATGNSYWLEAAILGRNAVAEWLTYDGVALLQLTTGAGADTIAVQSTHAATRTEIATGAGDDVITLGAGTQRLAMLAGSFAVDGGSGFDTLHVEDLANTLDAAGTLSAEQFAGFAMGGTVDYAAFNAMQMRMGSGADDLTVTSTHAGSTWLDLGWGDDTLAVGQDSLGPVVATVTDPGGSDTLNFSGSRSVSINLDATQAQTVNARGDTLTMATLYENFIGSPEADTIYAMPLMNTTRLLQGGPPPGVGETDLDGNFATGDTLFLNALGLAFSLNRFGTDGTVNLDLGGGLVAPTLSFNGIERLTVQNLLDLRGLPGGAIGWSDGQIDLNLATIPTELASDVFTLEATDSGEQTEPRNRGSRTPSPDAKMELRIIRIVEGQRRFLGSVGGDTFAETIEALGELSFPAGRFELIFTEKETETQITLDFEKTADGPLADEELRGIIEDLLDALEESGLVIPEDDQARAISMESGVLTAGLAALAAASLHAVRRRNLAGNWSESVDRLMERF
jgi:autotransporter-associated beta strand protein